MPRIRTIKPEFFTSLTIDKLSLAAQRTFIGLWTYADDHGRGMDDARLIKAAIWPLRDSHTVKKVEQNMGEIASLGLIRRYQLDGGRYFQILGWSEHQRVNRPSTSRIPQAPPPDDSPPPHGDLSEGSPGERKGTRERKGMDENPISLTEPSTQDQTRCVRCDFPYQKTLKNCPACAAAKPPRVQLALTARHRARPGLAAHADSPASKASTS